MFQSYSMSSFYNLNSLGEPESIIAIMDSDFTESINVAVSMWDKRQTFPCIADTVVKVYSEKELDVIYNLYLFTLYNFYLENKGLKNRLTKNKIRSMFCDWKDFSKYEKELYRCHAKHHKMKAFL